MSCGICKGADVALAAGGFLAEFPLLNGHEFAGYVYKVGEHVDTFKVGDRVTADNTVLCGDCYYCRKDEPLYCKNFYSLGCNGPGGFAEYVAVNADKVFPISDNLSFNEAIFAEPTACAVHSMDRIQVKFGDDVLVYGCGPTGIIMTQLLMHSNANRVVVCGPSQDKLDILKKYGCKETILMDRNDPSKHEAKLREIAPEGFDILVDTTANVDVMESMIKFGKMGAKFMMFAMPHAGAKWAIDPEYWYLHEIQLIPTWAQTHCFGRALEYLEAGKVQVKELVTHEMPLDDYDKGIALAAKGGPGTLKVILHPNYEE
jgi:D-arabinitol dehydrogenase (NADP+)